jgi:hypothetical protein
VNRREWLGLLGGAVAVAVLPVPVPTAVKALRPEYYADADAAFVVMDAPFECRMGDFICTPGGEPVGVALDSAKRGQRVLVQVYGETRVRYQ